MKYLIIILLITFCNICRSQQFTKCDVYQFKGVDSINKKIVLRETYNSQGLLISEKYNGYKENASWGIGDISSFYFYQDTLLIKRTSIDEWKDSTKLIYYYNKKKQMVKYEYFLLQKRLKKSAKRFIHNSGREGYKLSEKDYEKDRIWEKASEINYTYDNFGRRLSSYNTVKINYSDLNKHTWEYDSVGRILKECLWKDDMLFRIEEFTYFEGRYECKITWYDLNRNPKHLKKDDDYYPQTTCTYYLNEIGKVIKEMANTEKGKTTYTEILSYNANGQIAKTVYYNENGEPEITHIYVYY